MNLKEGPLSWMERRLADFPNELYMGDAEYAVTKTRFYTD